jgi:hypothetical protein
MSRSPTAGIMLGISFKTNRALGLEVTVLVPLEPASIQRATKGRAEQQGKTDQRFLEQPRLGVEAAPKPYSLRGALYIASSS